jgi:hypothetical protein
LKPLSPAKPQQSTESTLTTLSLQRVAMAANLIHCAHLARAAYRMDRHGPRPAFDRDARQHLVMNERDAVMHGETLRQEPLHPVTAGTGVEHDGQLAIVARCSQRGLELRGLDIGRGEKTLCSRTAGRSTAPQAAPGRPRRNPALANSLRATVGSASVSSSPRCAPMLRAAQLGK